MTARADPALEVDGRGLCNHCRRYDRLLPARVLEGERGRIELEKRVAAIKRAGRGRDYDCVIGVSGGADSTYVAYLTKELGLRPVAVHFDNGWNSALAVSNIHGVLERLGIDLDTCVVDWPEFRDLQLAFLRASTPDGEVPTDHAIQALLWRSAAKFEVKTVISGMNFRTEALSLPAWSYGHSDWRYIKGVHTRFGTVPLRTYPHYRLEYLLYVNAIRRIRSLSILNYVDYDKADAAHIIADKVGWKDYGGKHHESIYTRFFQGYILPRKFHIDKRVGQLSDLINSGQLSRPAALAELSLPPYDPKLQETDRVYVGKKLGLTRHQFDAMMAAPIKSFHDYDNSYRRVQVLRRTVDSLRGRGLYDA